MTYRIGHTGARSRGKHRAGIGIVRAELFALVSLIGPAVFLVVSR